MRSGLENDFRGGVPWLPGSNEGQDDDDDTLYPTNQLAASPAMPTYVMELTEALKTVVYTHS